MNPAADRPVLVAGGTGFVGRRLVAALVEAGREVRVMTRNPDRYRGPGTPVLGDVSRPETLAAPLTGCGAAFYLVHSLDSADFENRDASAAEAFGRGAAGAGVEQIVYLGGLGDDNDDLSAHLRSRREVETLLGDAGVPITVLRAGIVVGHGGISWELTRQLVEHLPAMITPRWVRTRTQPIAVDDVVGYLMGVLHHPDALGKVFEIGGPDVLEYVDMLKRVAAIEGRRLPIFPVPLLTPGLSSRWLSFVTDVDAQAGRNLIDSMVNEVVVSNTSIRDVVDLDPMGYDDAVRIALAERAADPEPDRPGSRLRQVINRVLPKPLTHVIDVTSTESDAVRRRRQVVVAGTAVAGAGLLGASLSTRPGSKDFYLSTAAVAGTWTLGGVLSGPLHLGWIENRDSTLRRPVLTPAVTGVSAFAVFYGAALVARQIPPLERALSEVLRFADEGDQKLVLATTLANGLGEEIFFRGALYAALGDRYPVSTSTAVYSLATTTTRNPALVLAATVMGTLFGLQRRASGGIQAPAITHLTWSTLMLHFLPPLFRGAAPAAEPTLPTAPERKRRRRARIRRNP